MLKISDINGKQLNTVTHHKQCKEYYDALERDDAAAAHMLYIPPSQTPLFIIQHRRRMDALKNNLEAELEFINNTPLRVKFCKTCSEVGKTKQRREEIKSKIPYITYNYNR